jgi:iron complex transport system ATP-binding protein
MDVRFESVSVELGGRAIVHALDLEAPSGQVVGLLGPNGSGKSTALRCLYRALRPSSGVVRVGDADLATLSPRSSAQRVSALAQDGGSDLDFTVRELVALGRTPHQRGNARLTAREEALCERAMADVDVSHLADRGVLQLSGGERQRVLVARALVQEPAVLVLDEPTNHLDVRHQIQLLRLVRSLGVTAVVVLHDLNLAAAVCDRVGVLAQGRLVAAGSPREVLTPDLIRAVFEVDAVVVDHPLTGAPQILFAVDGPATPPGTATDTLQATPERTTP